MVVVCADPGRVHGGSGRQGR